MERNITALPSGEQIAHLELLHRTADFFDKFPYSSLLPAIWTLIKGYASTKYQTNQQMVQDENIQQVLYLTDLLEDLDSACKEAFTNEISLVPALALQNDEPA